MGADRSDAGGGVTDFGPKRLFGVPHNPYVFVRGLVPRLLAALAEAGVLPPEIDSRVRLGESLEEWIEVESGATIVKTPEGRELFRVRELAGGDSLEVQIAIDLPLPELEAIRLDFSVGSKRVVSRDPGDFGRPVDVDIDVALDYDDDEQ